MHLYPSAVTRISSEPHMFRAFAPAVVLAITLVTGCTGLVDSNESFSNGDGRKSESGIDAAEGTLQRLTRSQYANTVKDLLGLSFDAVEGLPADDNSLGYTTGRNVSSSNADVYLTVAEQIAAKYAEGDLATELKCAGGALNDDCVTAFVEDFGTRAFRHPLTDEEHSRFMALYTSVKNQFDAKTGVETIVRATLSSPSFIYAVESTPGDAKDGDVIRLTGMEMATRLAFLLWNRGPDRELIDLAAAGELDTDEGVASVAKDMIADPRAKEGFQNFYEQWFLTNTLPNVQRTMDASLFPDATQLVPEMTASFRAMVDDVVWGQDGGIRELLLAPVMYVTPNTAPIFGVPSPVNGTMERLATVPYRVGVLTQPAFLTVTGNSTGSDPIHRGKFVFERLLCGTLQPPPVTVDTNIEKDTVGLTTRERYSEHSKNPECAGCHKHMDPIGFAFENFDQIGSYRTTDADKPVDATGEIDENNDADGTFEGVGELQALLAKSDVVADCVVSQYTRFAVGHFVTKDDDAIIAHAKKARDAENGALTAVVYGVASAPAFAYRRVPTPAQGATP